MRAIDHLSDVLGVIAAWMFFAIGGMITYEVVARYVFLAPTSWAEEMSRFFQIWATYLAAAYVLRHRDLITIDVLVNRLGARARMVSDLVSLTAILLFCAVAVYYGTLSVIESVQLGRATSTMLTVPLWMTEIAIPVGFGALALQCIAELQRVIRGESEPGGRAGPVL